MKALVMSMFAVAVLAGCQEELEPGPRAPMLIGETETGQAVYQFRLTRSNAIGITPVSGQSIQQRALQICPGGYRELRRSGEITRRVSGVIYTDVDVTIICT